MKSGVNEKEPLTPPHIQRREKGQRKESDYDPHR